MHKEYISYLGVYAHKVLSGGHKVTSNGTGLTSSKDEGNVQADNMPANTEAFHLGEYIEKLKREQIDWEEEYRKRRARRKDLTKQKAIAESQGQFLDIDRLTESEKAFVRMRPNYEDICKNMQKLSNVALKISILNQMVHNSHQKFTERMESNISRATRDIIQMLKD